MQTRLYILLICCLFSCSLFKNSTKAKHSNKSHSETTFAAQELSAKKESTTVSQTSVSIDSAETISLIEILPKGKINFGGVPSFSAQANRIRIFTRGKTGKTIFSQNLAHDIVSAHSQTKTALKKEDKTDNIEKSRQHQLPFTTIIIFIVVMGSLGFVVARYLRR